jgi:preprotein translocase subunit SecF
VPFEIIPAGTKIDFIGRRYLCGVISAALLLAGIAAIPIQGIRYGIDFAGGTEVQVLFDDDAGANEGAIRSVVSACGVSDPSVVRYGETDAAEFLIRFRTEAGADAVQRVAGADCPLTEKDREQLAKAAEAGGGGGEVGEKGEIVDRLELALQNAVGHMVVQRVEYVGPRVGAELRRDGLYAIGIASLLILAYIAVRFSARFAPGAVVALLHDVAITAGVFVICGWEFDLRVLAAMLAIMGYSLNDTIIVYDRIRENMGVRTKHDLVEVLNLSVNQTLSRTLLTSGTTMAAVLALLFVGGEVIRPFAIAMAIGIVVGTYSSIFIAAPTLLLLENRFGSRRAGGGEVGRGEAARGEAGRGEASSGRAGSGRAAAGETPRGRAAAGGTGGRKSPTSKRKKGKRKR